MFNARDGPCIFGANRVFVVSELSRWNHPSWKHSGSCTYAVKKNARKGDIAKEWDDKVGRIEKLHAVHVVRNEMFRPFMM